MSDDAASASADPGGRELLHDVVRCGGSVTMSARELSQKLGLQGSPVADSYATYLTARRLARLGLLFAEEGRGVVRVSVDADSEIRSVLAQEAAAPTPRPRQDPLASQRESGEILEPVPPKPGSAPAAGGTTQPALAIPPESAKARAEDTPRARPGSTVPEDRVPTPADGIRAIGMAWIWAFVWIVLAVALFGAEPWDAVRNALEASGPTDEQKSVMAFVAGYTFPLTLAFFGLTLAWLLGKARDAGPWAIGLTIFGALVGSGALAAELGLGLLPSSEFKPVSGPAYIALPADALQAYANSYGLPLMVSALALGMAGAVQVERWMRTASAP
jgi:hypothetical protein